jgi:parvulin-like peptidyl-prolyl isomerase
MNRTRLSVAMLVFMLSAPLLAGQGVIIEQIIVKVNGDIFTKSDLEEKQITALRDQNRQIRLSKELSDEALKPLLAKVTPDILVDAVDELLMVQRGREMGYRLSDDQFKDTVKGLMKENKITSDEQFQLALRQEGMTLADLRERLERSMLISKVQQQEVMPKVNLTDAEAHEYYNAHQSEFLKPSTIVVREMMVSVPTLTQAGQQVINAGAMDDAKAKLDAVIARLKAGEDFATIAKQISESPSKANGGLLPAIDETDLAKDVRDIFDKLNVGETTEPILTSRGYQIFKLESRTESAVEDFDKVKDQIINKVSNDRLDSETKKYVEKLRAQAIIEWKNDDLKKLYDQRLAARDAK